MRRIRGPAWISDRCVQLLESGWIDITHPQKNAPPKPCWSHERDVLAAIRGLLDEVRLVGIEFDVAPIRALDAEDLTDLYNDAHDAARGPRLARARAALRGLRARAEAKARRRRRSA